jgi:excisionase family DNA binding protein
MDGLPVSRLLALVREKVATDATPEQVWEHAELTGETTKPLIATRSGTALTTEQAAERLQVTEQTVRNRIRHGELVFHPSLRGRGWLLPHWQFIGEAPAAVASWVKPLLEAYGQNGWGLVDFLTVPRTDRHGANYLSLLLAGESGPVLAVARASNKD